MCEIDLYAKSILNEDARLLLIEKGSWIKVIEFKCRIWFYAFPKYPLILYRWYQRWLKLRHIKTQFKFSRIRLEIFFSQSPSHSACLFLSLNFFISFVQVNEDWKHEMILGPRTPFLTGLIILAYSTLG